MNHFSLATASAPSFAVAPHVRGVPADLYRSASSLLASADGMRRAAGTPGCESAIAASLAPMEAALENLERTVQAMEAVACERLSQATVLGGRWTYVGAARTVHEFEQFARALSNARRACQTARACAGPIIAELTAI